MYNLSGLDTLDISRLFHLTPHPPWSYSATSLTDEPEEIRRNCLRIGVILYVSAVRRSFGFHISTNIYSEELELCISKVYQVWEGHYEKLLWVLVVASLQSFGQQEHEWLVSVTGKIIRLHECSAWEHFIVFLHEIMWIERLFEGESEKLHGVLSGTLWNSWQYHSE